MAEFEKVIREYNRMCNIYDEDQCNHCPLAEDIQSDFTCPEYLTKNPNVVENIVMQWAVENPEPQYPMWIEVIRDMYQMSPGQAIYQPVPEDIAKKLGIKPIESSDNKYER